MKYGLLFSIVSVLLIATSIMHGGWYFLCLWPATSFGTVAVGYLFVGPAIYGKSETGMLPVVNTLLLFPYLLCLWAVWYGVRLIRVEAACDQLTENIYIGRRLLAREFPRFIDHVIDLTCEFTEPEPLRSADYHAMPILDGFAPDAKVLAAWVTRVASLDGTIYIHCAEGRGRTGLFAAALLVHLKHAQSVEDALQIVKTKRPSVRLNSQQLAVLAATQAT